VGYWSGSQIAIAMSCPNAVIGHPSGHVKVDARQKQAGTTNDTVTIYVGHMLDHYALMYLRKINQA
jgi:hypothetical protein